MALDAGHIPVIWATQVLDQMAGGPGSRREPRFPMRRCREGPNV